MTTLTPTSTPTTSTTSRTDLDRQTLVEFANQRPLKVPLIVARLGPGLYEVTEPNTGGKSTLDLRWEGRYDDPVSGLSKIGVVVAASPNILARTSRVGWAVIAVGPLDLEKLWSELITTAKGLVEASPNILARTSRDMNQAVDVSSAVAILEMLQGRLAVMGTDKIKNGAGFLSMLALIASFGAEFDDKVKELAAGDPGADDDTVEVETVEETEPVTT
jgi:hypothetical protein